MVAYVPSVTCDYYDSGHPRPRACHVSTGAVSRLIRCQSLYSDLERWPSLNANSHYSLIAHPRDRIATLQDVQSLPFFTPIPFTSLRQLDAPFVPVLDGDSDVGYFDSFSSPEDMAKYAEVFKKQKDVEAVKEEGAKDAWNNWVSLICWSGQPVFQPRNGCDVTKGPRSEQETRWTRLIAYRSVSRLAGTRFSPLQSTPSSRRARRCRPCFERIIRVHSGCLAPLLVLLINRCIPPRRVLDPFASCVICGYSFLLFVNTM
jgi:hypothetical protein